MIITIVKSLKHWQERGILPLPAFDNFLISHLKLNLCGDYFNSQWESSSFGLSAIGDDSAQSGQFF